MLPMTLGVIPILVGPLQVLLALLPAIAIALASALLAMFKPSTVKLLGRLLWRMKKTVVLIVAVTVGGYYLLGAVIPATRVSGEAQAGTDWPMFRGDMGRSGAVAGTASPASGGVRWAMTKTKTFFSSPAVVGNRLYATAADIGVFSDRGTIYCLDTETGGIVWEKSPPGFRATFSSPSISGRYLVTGEGLHLTKAARIFCLDVENQGEVLWSFTTGCHVESSAVIDGDRLYIGAGDDGYYAFKLDPDDDGNPQMLWHVDGERYPDAETSPVIHEGRFYAGLGIEGQALICLDAATGEEFWRVPTPSPVFAAPAVANGRVIFGMGQGNFIESEEQVIAAALKKLRDEGRSDEDIEEATKAMKVEGEIWCVDAMTGELLWKFETDRSVLGSVAVREDRVYAATRGGNVYSLSMDGDVLGEWKGHVPILASPAVTDQNVYIVNERGRLLGLDRMTLQPVWETSLGESGLFLSSPAVAHGHVYVGSGDHGMLSAGEPSTVESIPLWQGALGGPGHLGSPGQSQLPERGIMLWRYPTDRSLNDEKPVEFAATAPGVVLEDMLLLPVAEGPQRGLICLPSAPRDRRTPVPMWSIEAPLGVHHSPARHGNLVVYVEGKTGDAGRRLCALNAENGEALWCIPVDAEVSGEFLLTPNEVLVQDMPGMLSAYDHKGQRVWQRPTGELVGTASVAGDLVAVAAADSVSLLDRPTGRLLWQVASDATTTVSPVFEDDRILAGTSTGVSAHEIVDGRVLWATASGAVSGGMAKVGNSLVYNTTQGELIFLEAAAGVELKRIEGFTPGLPPVALRSQILAVTDDALMLVDPGTGEVKRWMATGWLGRATAPVIAADGVAYLFTDRAGLICVGERK